MIKPELIIRGMRREELDILVEWLHEPAVIGMDGVFDMQPYYAKGGFRFAARDLRYEGVGQSGPDPAGVTDLSTIPFADIETYDRAHFPAPRSGFLLRWLEQPGAHALGLLNRKELTGMGVTTFELG